MNDCTLEPGDIDQNGNTYPQREEWEQSQEALGHLNKIDQGYVGYSPAQIEHTDLTQEDATRIDNGF